MRMSFRALAVTLAASFVAIAPTPASADTHNVKIVNAGSGLRADVMWAFFEPFQGVFLWPDNASASQMFDLLDSGGGFFPVGRTAGSLHVLPDARDAGQPRHRTGTCS